MAKEAYPIAVKISPMIEQISLCEVATFGTSPSVLSDLRAINFIYGANGAGKTTISRAIADDSRFPRCEIRWQGNTRLEALVYNRDFIAKNFEQSSSLPGVFTLGESNIDIAKQIEEKSKGLDKLTTKLKKLNDSLKGEDGKSGYLRRRQECVLRLEKACWTQKQKYNEVFAEAFQKHRKSMKSFAEKVLAESAINTAATRSLEELRAEAATVFADKPEAYPKIARFVAVEELKELESHPILTKLVVGRGNIDIARLIQKLGSSDWVRQGRPFHAETGHATCPFCQQPTSASLESQLNEYFDESFERDIDAIQLVASRYQRVAREIEQYVQSLQLDKGGLLNLDALKLHLSVIQEIVSGNLARLASKVLQPSQSVELKPLVAVVTDIATLVGETNARIELHNVKVENLDKERQLLTEQVWKYIVEELAPALDQYKSELGGIDAAINGITKAIADAEGAMQACKQEIAQLERQITSVQPTISAINGHLREFGFTGFSLELSKDGKSYCLKRENGADAKETLSEGERTFITFLYFYCLIKGSTSQAGVLTTRIVVFDDPVSSLDSDILFVVGSLIRAVFAEIRGGVGSIRQAIVLTHNVYFHKEVSYASKRSKEVCLNDETFWIVCKTGAGSVVTRYPNNPIQTSYELLWEEVRNENRNNATIQNTLRRILENYFKIIGGIDYEKVCDSFKGHDKTICKSLCSWVHDGSHHAHDNLFVVVDSSMVGHYLKVFRKIFELLEHGAHYKMMMKEAYEEQPIPAVASLATVGAQIRQSVTITAGVYESVQSARRGTMTSPPDVADANANDGSPTMEGSVKASQDTE